MCFALLDCTLFNRILHGQGVIVGITGRLLSSLLAKEYTEDSLGQTGL